MDMKKKLEDTYMPDKDARKKRVVVGLSGSINSLVTAYLLKLQKFDLIGVTVALGWDEFEGNSDNVLSCHLNSAGLENIRQFCHQLGIPHFVVKGSDEFKEEVVERWMASRVTATKSQIPTSGMAVIRVISSPRQALVSQKLAWIHIFS